MSIIKNKNTKHLYDKMEVILKNKEALGEKLKSQYINEDGKAEIDVVLNKDNVYDQFSSPKQRRLNPEIYNFIDSKTYFIPYRIPIALNIIIDLEEPKEDDLELTDFVVAEISNHYLLQVADKKDDLKKVKIVYWILFIIGALLLTLYFIIERFVENPVFTEVISIAGTFSIWEAVDFLLIQKTQKTIEMANVIQVAVADVKINYKDHKNEEK